MRWWAGSPRGRCRTGRSWDKEQCPVDRIWGRRWADYLGKRRTSKRVGGEVEPKGAPFTARAPSGARTRMRGHRAEPGPSIERAPSRARNRLNNKHINDKCRPRRRAAPGLSSNPPYGDIERTRMRM